MDHYDHSGLPRRRIDTLVVFLENPPPFIRLDHEARLQSPVVSEADAIHAESLQLESRGARVVCDLFCEFLDEGPLSGDAGEEILEAAETPASFEDTMSPTSATS